MFEQSESVGNNRSFAGQVRTIRNASSGDRMACLPTRTPQTEVGIGFEISESNWKLHNTGCHRTQEFPWHWGCRRIGRVDAAILAKASMYTGIVSQLIRRSQSDNDGSSVENCYWNVLYITSHYIYPYIIYIHMGVRRGEQGGANAPPGFGHLVEHLVTILTSGQNTNICPHLKTFAPPTKTPADAHAYSLI